MRKLTTARTQTYVYAIAFTYLADMLHVNLLACFFRPVGCTHQSTHGVLTHVAGGIAYAYIRGAGI